MIATKTRVRIRFQKAGDLRLISHRDLARTFERLFRRVGIQLGMSEGFHPKAKLSFPSALSLGICGADEIIDVELVDAASFDDLFERLNASAPSGLVINSTRLLEPNEKKAKPQRMHYSISIPPARRAELQTSIDHLLAQSTFPIAREGSDKPVDVRAGLAQLELADGALRYSLFTTPPAKKGGHFVVVNQAASVRPREVLQALGLDGLEDEGYYLTRTAVELPPPNDLERTQHEKGNVD